MKKYWLQIIAPHPSIKDEETQINSRLLSILMLVLLPLAILFMVGLSLPFSRFDEGLTVDIFIFGALVTALWGMLVINRLGYFQAAITTILILGGLTILIEAVLDNDMGDLAFLLLPIIIAGLFLTRNYLILLGAFFLGVPIAYIFLLPEAQLTIIRFVLPLLFIGIILTIISRLHRDFLEGLRNKKLIESELRYSLVAGAVNDGIWDWDFTQNRVFYSTRWKEMIGYKPDEVSDSPDEWLRRVHPDDIESVESQFRNAFLPEGSDVFEMEYRFRHKDGSYIWVLSRGRVIFDEVNTPIRTIGSHTNITLRKQAQEKLSFDAMHDTLTGLANRALFNEKLNHVIKHARKNEGFIYAVLFLDLDNFKDINDSMGHKSGDDILKQFSERMLSSLFDVDTLARLGGDEFVILLESLDSTRRPVDVVQRIKKSLSQPFIINNASIFLTASIGVVIGTREYTTSEEILRDADIAMYHAKGLGKDTFEIFNPAMREHIMRRLDLERDLRQAVQKREFILEYQPITNLSTSNLLGFEALIRWNHPRRGMIPPSEFIPIAEQTGLIIPIGYWVFQTACQQLKEWEDKYPPVKNLTLNINVSGKQLTHAKFHETVSEILETTHLPAYRINLEITETVILEDNPDTYSTLTNLARQGFNMQLDDFGKGQSSLGYLQKYPLSGIKIDRSFVSLLHNKREYGLIQGIIQLAKALDLKTIAEGIESKEHNEMLQFLECDNGQGFGISRPISVPQIEKILSQHGNDNSTYLFPANDFQA